ncbi:YlbF family regulator [Halarsenatibacter silvermanii]|uniref:Cell fate regulator YlbF, YheA/YmcA/DUF963 family (Controls sporulation, competence, biofilm development) n=1 Tax=Halarsenatibacter silvermanii TaxID=321763 RepID=A0A1G9LK91_9FIRM|nr:YlbF family regulator [Halarsenatibacter silvermanii]SDL62350.1 Cell fate regulator YlbF, YheA/YmcA/DUF963 family (controls sporulation, competence, biofilm development) [Halarsenatibacter silvermanii]
MAIKEKARELAQEIVSSQAYQEMKDAEEAVMADDEAGDLMEELESVQKRVQMAQMNGQEIDQSQKKKLQNLKAKMQQNPKIKDFLTAQQEFNGIMEDVNEIISNTLQGQEPEEEEDSGGQIIT